MIKFFTGLIIGVVFTSIPCAFYIGHVRGELALYEHVFAMIVEDMPMPEDLKGVK